MNCPVLEKSLGKSLRASEVAEYLRLDIDLVRKPVL
jgi:hypothetical protein